MDASVAPPHPTNPCLLRWSCRKPLFYGPVSWAWNNSGTPSGSKLRLDFRNPDQNTSPAASRRSFWSDHGVSAHDAEWDSQFLNSLFMLRSQSLPTLLPREGPCSGIIRCSLTSPFKSLTPTLEQILPRTKATLPTVDVIQDSPTVWDWRVFAILIAVLAAGFVLSM